MESSILPKNKLKNQPESNCFRLFFGRIGDTKIHSEINWPLETGKMFSFFKQFRLFVGNISAFPMIDYDNFWSTDNTYLQRINLVCQIWGMYWFIEKKKDFLIDLFIFQGHSIFGVLLHLRWGRFLLRKKEFSAT